MERDIHYNYQFLYIKFKYDKYFFASLAILIYNPSSFCLLRITKLKIYIDIFHELSREDCVHHA